MQIKRKIKRFGRALIVFPMTFKGYALPQARAWWDRRYDDWKYNNEISLIKKTWAHRRGFLSDYVNETEIDATNYKKFISEKQYRYIQPINEKYNKWLNDKISVMRVYHPFIDLFPTIHYHFYVRDNKWKIIGNTSIAKECGETVDGFFELLETIGELTINLSHRKRPVDVSYNAGVYFINNEEITKEMMHDFVFRRSSSARYWNSTIIVTETLVEDERFVDEKNFEKSTIKLYVLNSEGDNPMISDAFLVKDKLGRRHMEYFDQLKMEKEIKEQDLIDKLPTELNRAITRLEEAEIKSLCSWHRIDADTGYCVEIANGKTPYYDDITNAVEKICLFTPQLEFFAIDVVITEYGFKFSEMISIPEFPYNYTWAKETNEFLLEKYHSKRASFSKLSKLFQHSWKRITLQVRKKFVGLLFPETLYPYLGIRTFQEVTNDFFTNKDANFKEKIWAYKYGFQSYRLSQYGITRQNHKKFISDFEYKWLRHINSKYRTWFEDKVTIKYVLRDFEECFPGYYYFTAVKNGNNKIIPLMDCPAGYEASYDDIFKLVQEKGILALKPDEGSHGEGFFKFSYRNGKYYLNSEVVNKERVVELFQTPDNQYLITEFIQMHPDIAKIYAGSVNTVRLTVFKKDGVNATIGNGYMRYGTTETGGVDNIGAGGIGVDVDVETGRFYNPVKFVDGAILVPCEYHPDTGEKIEGYLPNWEYVKETVLKVAESVPEVEYFGFDLAITEHGIKFPEINRFPDYPRINKLTPRTIDYLLYKLDKKKDKYGYNGKNAPKKVFNLPKR